MFQLHKTHFCGGNQKKCLCILARTHSGDSQQVPPKDRKNIKGHIRQHYKGTQSTRLKQEVPIMTQQSPPEILTERTNHFFLKVTECSNRIYTDQTGRFPVTSSRGYNYIMIAYDYVSNNILAEPIESRTSLHIKNAYQTMRKLPYIRRLTPKTHVLDNECSKVLKEYTEEKNDTFQMVPPHLHRQNTTERAIQTFKNHFIAGMVPTQNNFLLHLWCRLLP